MELTVGSLFAGIGGFDLGLERVGMRVLWQVEIDPACNRVLERYWPGVRRFGDIREVKAGELEPVDVLAGGVPCQDWSVAGRRAGLAGGRSGLFFEFARLADALAPAWVLFENVPGLLSAHRGEDFATVLECLTGCRPQVPPGGWKNCGFGRGPKRSVAWRILDAQWFGIPQRRRRLFLVGRARAPWAAPAQVLFEPACCPGNPPPRRKAGSAVASLLASGAGTSRPAGIASEADFLIADPVAHPLTAHHSGQRWEPTNDTYVIQDVRGGTRDRTDHGQGIGISGEGVCYTLDATSRHGMAQAALAYSIGKGSHPLWAEELAQPITGRHGDPGHVVHTLCGEGADASEDGTGRGVPLVVGTLAPGAHPGGLAGREAEQGLLVVDEVAPTLTTKNEVASSSAQRWRWMEQSAQTIGVVRRLTPLECERLQGFPDGWTEGESDSARYRMLGNAVAVPVVEWI